MNCSSDSNCIGCLGNGTCYQCQMPYFLNNITNKCMSHCSDPYCYNCSGNGTCY